PPRAIRHQYREPWRARLSGSGHRLDTRSAGRPHLVPEEGGDRGLATGRFDQLDRDAAKRGEYRLDAGLRRLASINRRHQEFEHGTSLRTERAKAFDSAVDIVNRDAHVIEVAQLERLVRIIQSHDSPCASTIARNRRDL